MIAKDARNWPCGKVILSELLSISPIEQGSHHSRIPPRLPALLPARGRQGPSPLRARAAGRGTGSRKLDSGDSAGARGSTKALMMDRRAVPLALRPLSEPLPLPLQQRGRKVLEALERLDRKDQLELACRTVLGVLMAAQPRFRGRERTHLQRPLCGGAPVVEAQDDTAPISSPPLRREEQRKMMRAR